MADSYLPDIHRMLPQSPDAEKGLLGSILLDPAVLDGCAEGGIHTGAFHIPAHQIIFTNLQSLRDANQPIDIITLTQILRDRNKLEEAGGPALVSSLMTFVPTSANASYYMEIMQEKYTLRSIIRTCTEYTARSYDEQENVPMLLDEVEQKIFEIAQERYKEKRKTMREHVFAVMDRLSALHDKKGASGLLTGLRALDDKLGGFHNGEVTVLTGTTGGGKTSFAHTIIAHAAIDLKRPVLLFSFEMNALWVTNRLLCARARINTEAMRTGAFSESDFRSFSRHADEVKSAPIFIEDDPDTAIDALRAKARRHKASNGISLVVVDYIQKITPTGRGHSMRQREVAIISDGLQKMAMELNVPVLALAQENPDGEAREARDIAFDAKVVLKIKREDESVDIESEGSSAKRLVVIRKNNTGSIGTLPMTFLKQFVTFTDFAPSTKEFSR